MKESHGDRLLPARRINDRVEREQVILQVSQEVLRSVCNGGCRCRCGLRCSIHRKLLHLGQCYVEWFYGDAEL